MFQRWNFQSSLLYQLNRKRQLPTGKSTSCNKTPKLECSWVGELTGYVENLNLLKMYNPHIVFFMETKLNDKKMENFCRRCGFTSGVEVLMEGLRGRLSLAWSREVILLLEAFQVIILMWK